MAVDLAGFLDSQEELGGRALDVGAGRGERTIDAGERERADEFRVAIDEGLHRGGVGRLGDEVSDVDGEEVGDADEALDGLQADVVGVEEIRSGPAERLHGGVGRGAGARRLGADDVVLAVGLVPDRHDLDAELLGREAGGELGFGFVGEAVAHAEGEFTDDERLGGHTRGKAARVGPGRTRWQPPGSLIFGVPPPRFSLPLMPPFIFTARPPYAPEDCCPAWRLHRP